MTAKEVVGILNEKTRVPLSLVITVCGFMAILIVWGVKLEARVENLESHEAILKEIRNSQSEMKQDIAVIKVKIERLK